MCAGRLKIRCGEIRAAITPYRLLNFYANEGRLSFPTKLITINKRKQRKLFLSFYRAQCLNLPRHRLRKVGKAKVLDRIISTNIRCRDTSTRVMESAFLPLDVGQATKKSTDEVSDSDKQKLGVGYAHSLVEMGIAYCS